MKWNIHYKGDQRCNPEKSSSEDTLTESGMKMSNTFNPRSDRQSWSVEFRVPEGGEGLTGRLDYRHDALSNARSLPQWSRSSMLHPKVLETGKHLTPLLTVLLF